MNPCAARLAGQLRDPLSDRTFIDSRIINLQLTDDGWTSSDPKEVATFSNPSVCPNLCAAQDRFGNEYELTVTVTDRDGREVTKSVHVIPTWDEPGVEASCLCHCSKDYKLGQACPNGSGAGGMGGAGGT